MISLRCFRRRGPAFPACLSLGLLLTLGPMARAQVLYQTGFERPEFAPGALAGQGGWSDFGFGTGSRVAARIQTATVAAGLQALEINAALASDSVYYWPDLQYDTATASNKVVSVRWDMLLGSAGTPSPAWGVTVADDLLTYVGGLLVDGQTGEVFVESADDNLDDGDAANNRTGFFVARGQWNTFEMRLDYTSRTFDSFVNGQLVRGGFALAEASTNVLGDADLTLGKGPAASGTDSAFFDNYRIAAVPEPGTGVLIAGVVALVAVPLALRRRTS